MALFILLQIGILSVVINQYRLVLTLCSICDNYLSNLFFLISFIVFLKYRRKIQLEGLDKLHMTIPLAGGICGIRTLPDPTAHILK